MAITGCKKTFTDPELRRVLPEKLYQSFEQLKQRREIELAGLNLVICPFCDYMVEMDLGIGVVGAFTNFTCPNCFKTSCRKCRKDVRTHSGRCSLENANSRCLEPSPDGIL
jgi:TRIAD3 protein (E3 ubiquitin-protein ligase RNF216)